MVDKTPGDVKQLLDAERAGSPFLVLRDGAGKQTVLALDAPEEPLNVGRDPSSDICLAWDARVSGLHARLECTNGFWFLHDDGFSRNGSFLNGERVHGHRILGDRDELRFGRTTVQFRDPSPRAGGTVVSPSGDAAALVSPAEKKVLIALCRPYKHRPAFSRPATNQEIADELFLSVEAVKSHLRVLFAKCQLKSVPQSEKRVRLVEHALRNGLVAEHEL